MAEAFTDQHLDWAKAMTQIRDEIHLLLKSDNPSPSLGYWCHVLNYFERNVDDLNIAEVRLLEKESERCREIWNRDREEKTELKKADGSIQTLITRKAGLDIAREEVNPNITRHLQEMERLEDVELEENDTDKVEAASERIDPNQIPLAALPA